MTAPQVDLPGLFTRTLSPDANIRKAAELEVRRIQAEEGLISALIGIVGGEGTDVATRQACAIWIKNRVFAHYNVETAKGAVPPSDRTTLRTALLPLLASAPPPIVPLVAATLRIVVGHDLGVAQAGGSSAYPSFIPDVQSYLAAGRNAKEVKAGVIAALEGFRAFRYSPKQDHVEALSVAFFPRLGEIAAELVAHAQDTSNEEAGELLHLIFKTYKTSTASSLSTHQRSPESLIPWGRVLFDVVKLRIPGGEEREGSEWWKAKKWGYKVLGRLFHRYGNPSQLPNALVNDYKPFAEHFVTAFAPEILGVYLGQVDMYVRGEQWMSDKVQYHVFTFFTECIKPSSTWTLLKPHFPTLISSFVFPLLSFTPSRREMWESDPVEYIRVGLDEYENYQTPVAAATTFLLGLMSNRTKAAFSDVVQWVMSVLTTSPSPERQFGALNLLAAIGPWMMRHPAAKAGVQEFVTTHVLAGLLHAEPWIRAISCELLGTLVKNRLPYPGTEPLDALVSLLSDPFLPVKVHAVLALTEAVVRYDEVKEGLRTSGRVGGVVGDLLALSESTELDVLNHSMEVFVDTYDKELLPYAAGLVRTLCDTYLRFAREGAGNQDITAPDLETMDIGSLTAGGDDDKTFHAMGIAKTIWTVITAVDSSPPILAEVAELVTPIVVYTLEARYLDLLDSMYDLVDSLTFKLRRIPAGMWRVFELTHGLVKGTGAVSEGSFGGEGVDYLEEMLPSLDNFVSFGSEHILASPAYKQALVEMWVESQTNAHLGEADRVNGCKLAESMMLNLRGGIDEALPLIVRHALPDPPADTQHLRLARIEVLVGAILYNPAKTLNIMFESGVALPVLSDWFAAVQATYSPPAPARGVEKPLLLKRVHDKRLSILALCAMMELDASAVPEALRANWNELPPAALKLFKDFAKAVESREALEAAPDDDDEEDDEDIDDSEFLRMNEDDEDVWDEESAYLEMLANEGARLRAKAAKNSVTDGSIDADDYEDDDEDEDESDDEITEELGFYTPLDGVDVYVMFRDALAVFQSKGGQLNSGTLPAELQGVLVDVIKKAEGGRE